MLINGVIDTLTRECGVIFEGSVSVKMGEGIQGSYKELGNEGETERRV